ncbi:hypothetical protein [Novosphingobium sp. 9U]|uniref:hypothetical protein n=1 Tax=Novosphingobium sp. 9U TaxID=2653158 RepID=UPI0012F08EC5|nr:hypothetical protein [Novosphingobium sp. 9U]VWX52032.1 Beta-lactamase-like protein [Novosphingobium sp. 9U]
MTRKLNVVLLILLLVIGAPFTWLLLNASTRGTQAKPVTIAQLRQLAESMPGPAPTQVRYEAVGDRHVMSDLLAAGSGLRPVPFMIRAYELVGADGTLATIDRGLNRELAERRRLSHYDPMAQRMVERALAAAPVQLSLGTDAHHSGMAAAAPQLGSGLAGPAERSPAQPYPVAHGIVVIPVSSIAPGQRMVYARLGNGREVLFTGDVAPINAAWEDERPPARIVTGLFVDHDREEIGSWLRTISALRGAAPGLHIVTGHDQQVPRLLVQGFIERPAQRRRRRR